MLCGEETGSWRPLVEYSLKKGVSLSTLRRYIKAGKVQYKVESGRYLLFDGAQKAHDDSTASPDAVQLNATVRRLELELQNAREEIAELKTLIAFYEEQPPSRSIDV